jgi:hypothetical protein
MVFFIPTLIVFMTAFFIPSYLTIIFFIRAAFVCLSVVEEHHFDAALAPDKKSDAAPFHNLLHQAIFF